MKSNSSNSSNNKKASWEIPWAIQGLHGYVAAPTVLVRNKGRLGLGDDELCLILAIMTYKWDEAAPWPSVESLADYLGWSSRSVQRALRKLEGKHKSTMRRGAYLTVTARKTGPKRNETNTYDFTPLFVALAKLEVLADKNGIVPQEEENTATIAEENRVESPRVDPRPAPTVDTVMPSADELKAQEIAGIQALDR
jgi:hypothetical protein